MKAFSQSVLYLVIAAAVIALFIWAYKGCGKPEDTNGLADQKKRDKEVVDSMKRVFYPKIDSLYFTIFEQQEVIDSLQKRKEWSDSVYAQRVAKLTIDINGYRFALSKKDSTGALNNCSLIIDQLFMAGLEVNTLRTVRDSLISALIKSGMEKDSLNAQLKLFNRALDLKLTASFQREDTLQIIGKENARKLKNSQRLNKFTVPALVAAVIVAIIKK